VEMADQGTEGCGYAFIQKKKAIAETVYNQEVARWENERKANKQGQWVSTVVEAGTMRDKVNGLVLLIQQSPFHRLATLDQLISLAQSHTTRIAILAIESIKSLFSASYLPDNKLVFFATHFETITEEEAEEVNIQELVRWYYEDAVKVKYATFIQCLEKASHSSLREAKNVAIGTLQRMLIEKPEQEHTILSLLVDKMGDPHSKTATWTTNLILGILAQHPNMKLVIAKEVQLFINKHTPLTTTIPLSLLSHIVLARGETELANMLVSTYFRQLKVLSEQKVAKKTKGKKQKKGQEAFKKNTDESSSGDANDTKMASVLLTGVNRAFPYSKLPQDVYESHLEILFELVEHGGFNRKVLALVVIFKVIKLQQEISDNVDALNRNRFYHLLYDLLLSAELSSGFGQPNYKQAFFALVEGAIATDKDHFRARAFLKRLLVMSASARPGFACSSILLAARLFKDNSSFSSMVLSCDKPKTSKPDPIFHAEGNSSCLWELCALRCHYHPLVARWAQLLSANHQIQYDGNPLDDLSTNMFLSRFQNKQPSTKHRVKGKVMEMQPRRPAATPVTFSFTLKDFQTKKEKDIRPDEVFFFRYLQLKIQTLDREDQLDEIKNKKKKKKREKKEGVQVSTEALLGLLEAEAEDGNFGMEGEGLIDDDDDDDEDGDGGFGTFAGKRGEKRKGAPAGKAPRAGKGTKDEKKSGKKGGKNGKAGKKEATKKKDKKAKKPKKNNSKRQKTK